LDWQAIRFPWCLLLGMLRSWLIVRRFRPHVVVGTGGYVSGPAVLLASLMGVPTLIHEQNSLPGATTRLLSSRVDQVHLSFPHSRRYFRRQNHLRINGNPLRAGMGRVERSEACRSLSLDPRRKTVLITGGSQGAHSVNMAVADDFEQLKTEDVQILWQTGSRDLAMIRERFQDQGRRMVVTDFISDMRMAYGAADVVVCRAGATTVAEVAVCGLPAIFVPYPYATADHQRINALAMVKTGAAEMVLNGELKGGRLMSVLISLLRDETKRKTMAHNSRQFGHPEAAVAVARAVCQLARGR
jgi:UDP-N-acetylglucosamine--N-acetylmuramyl-(pentapeptide) pyrophosphoryl-undecaprenol N-acetylglucosamine transferase